MLTTIDLDDPNVGYLTFEQYLEAEHSAQGRHEYNKGTIVAMGGASSSHYTATVNLTGCLWALLKGTDFRMGSSDARVSSPGGSAYYPDLVVFHKDAAFLPDGYDTLTEPVVVGEVLSPSTAAYDRGDKFDAYEQIASLTDYVIAHQDRVLVEHYARRTLSDAWTLHRVSSSADMLRLDSISAHVPLTDVYLNTGLLDG